MSDEAKPANLPSTAAPSVAGPEPEPTITEVANNEPEPVGAAASVTSGFQFWMIFISLMVSTFLSAIDLTTVSVTLPTIIADLHGSEFAWVGSGYALGSAAGLPLIGGLAQVFGRRPVVLGSLFFFAVGSALCGAAQNMAMLIAGRAIQGIGGGGILAMTEIVVADLVPLNKRGVYMGIIGAVWALASAIGPPIGGAFSQSNWRWLFYMNLPICGIAALLIAFFLQLKIPQDDFRTKMRRMDWFGNFLIVVSTTITIIALTWAGVRYSWSSYHVLVPLILGIVGLVAAFVYEANFPKEPVIPWTLINNRTAFFAHLTTFVHSVVVTAVVYYLPVYFQGALLQSPVHSGVSVFGNAFTVAPGGIVCGAAVTISKRYKPQNFVGWGLTIIGFGLLTILKYDSPTGQWVGFQIVEGFGLGILYAATNFPVLAAVPVSETAHALALFTFFRTFAQTWGVTIGATILQNQLTKKLPSDFLDQVSRETGIQRGEIAYALIPTLKTLQEPLRTTVRQAFAESVRVIWLVMVGLSAFGFICVFAIKELPMHEVTDEDWGLKEKEKEKQRTSPDSEKA